MALFESKSLRRSPRAIIISIVSSSTCDATSGLAMRLRDCRVHPFAQGNPRRFELNSRPVSGAARTYENNAPSTCPFLLRRQLRAGTNGSLTLLITHLFRFLILRRLCWWRRRFGEARLPAVFATLILCAFQIVFLGHLDRPVGVCVNRATPRGRTFSPTRGQDRPLQLFDQSGRPEEPAKLAVVPVIP